MNELILEMLNVVLQTSFFAFSLIMISKLITKISYTRKQMILTIVSILIANIVAILVKMVIPIFNTFIFIIWLSLSEILILKVSKLKSLLIVIVTEVVNFISELLGFFIISLLFRVTTEQIYSNDKILLLLFLTINFINYAIVIIYTLIHKKRTSVKSLDPSDSQLITIILLLLISALPQIIIFILTDYSYPKIVLIINIVQMALFCVILFSYLKANLQKEKAESELEISELHNKTMVNMVDGVRTLKHDYNNIMQALNGYISTKQYDKLQEHINKVLDECNIVNNLSLIDPKIFNDPAIYGIVGAKYFMAIESDIKFEFDIVTNIREIDFSMPELSRILGILLDNAIEATLKTDNKYIKLEMKYDSRKGADIIKVYNTYDTSISIDLKEIYEKGVSSKEVKSGIGLWEVKKLIKRSKNSQIYATIEQNMFVQNIIIEKTT